MDLEMLQVKAFLREDGMLCISQQNAPEPESPDTEDLIVIHPAQAHILCVWLKMLSDKVLIEPTLVNIPTED